MATGRAVALASVLLIVSAASGSAQEGQDDFSRNGFYVGLAGSLAIDAFKDGVEENINDKLAALGYVDLGYRNPPNDPEGVVVWVDCSGMLADVNVDPSIGVNARVGYRFHPNVSAELQAEWITGFKANIGASNLQIKRAAGDQELALSNFASADVEPLVITGNVKGHLLTGPYQPFLLAGVGLMIAKLELEDSQGIGYSDSDRFSGFAARFGGGIDFYATEHFVLTLGVDYVLPTGDAKDLHYISVGWGFQYRF